MRKASPLLALLASLSLCIALQLNKGKKWTTDATFRQAMDVMRAVVALNDYGRYFAHPGWKAIK